MPAITLPLMRGANGLPLGCSWSVRGGGDARLLRTARWLVEQVRAGNSICAKRGADRRSNRQHPGGCLS